MVEPVTLPRNIAPVVPGNRIRRANASEDRKQGFAFEKQLRKEHQRQQGAPPDGEAGEEPGEGERLETAVPLDETVTGEVLPEEGAAGKTQAKTIDIRV
jgi:hypothetical protein